MDNQPLVYAITLNWNNCVDTVDCLHALHALEHDNLRVLLVDNGSTDDTVATVRDQFRQTEIIVNETNLGFGAGNNVGMRHALEQNPDYVLLINNDAIIAPDALTQMLAYAAPDVGAMTPMIYYAADPQRIWSIGGDQHPLTYEKINDARGQIDDGHWTVTERDFATGCTLLLSRTTLEQVGLFDERFFMYYEDSDLSARIRSNGLRMLLVPSAKVWHKVALSSGGSDSPSERYWMARSSILFFHKQVRGWHWLIVVPYRTASAIKTILRLLLQHKRDSARAYMRGLRDGFADVQGNG